jgi:helix-turn-helix protein
VLGGKFTGRWTWFASRCSSGTATASTRGLRRVAFGKAFGCVRVVFNDGLAARQQARAAGQPFLTDADLPARPTAAKTAPQRSWLSEVSAVLGPRKPVTTPGLTVKSRPAVLADPRGRHHAAAPSVSSFTNPPGVSS